MDKLRSIRVIKTLDSKNKRAWKVKLKARKEFLFFTFNHKPNMDEVELAYKTRIKRDGKADVIARLLHR